MVLTHTHFLLWRSRTSKNFRLLRTILSIWGSFRVKQQEIQNLSFEELMWEHVTGIFFLMSCSTKLFFRTVAIRDYNVMINKRVNKICHHCLRVWNRKIKRENRRERDCKKESTTEKGVEELGSAVLNFNFPFRCSGCVHFKSKVWIWIQPNGSEY